MAAPNAPAAGMELAGSAEVVTMEGLVASGVSWSVVPGAEDSALSLTIARIDLDDVEVAIEGLRLRCPHWRVGTVRQVCAAGELEAVVDDQRVTARVSWDSDPGTMRLEAETDLLQGRLALTLIQDADGPQLTFRADALALAALVDDFDLLPPELIGVQSGHASLEGHLDRVDGVDRAEVRFEVAGLGFDSADGTIAGAALGLSGTVRLELGADPLSLQGEVALERGEVLYAPIYVALDELPPLRFGFDGLFESGGALDLRSFTIGDGDSLALTGSVRLGAAGEAGQLSLEIERFVLPLAFDRYLKTALESRGIRGLRPGGEVRGRLELGGGALTHLTAAFEAFSLDDERERFLIDELNGLVDYDAEGDSLDSQLSWNRMGYYALVVRASQARFFIGGRQFRLLDPLFAPVLDGGLEVEELAITDFGLEGMTLDFTGEIQPISLELITRALEWPVLRGTLSGTVPRVSLRGGVGEVGGAIRLDVFDGEVIVDQVKLERVFGVLPTLAAEVEVRNVDLKQMTGAFEFGEIEGRLDGTVRGLRLLDWEPVAFDLALKTPDDFKGKRKISQRAVENLSSLGGGAAALSQTLLRFFDKFSYRRLGLTCRLLDNVCRMGGIAPAGAGYYIVEGAGIPRINIIGFSTEVDWPQLIRRLQAATRGGAPTID